MTVSLPENEMSIIWMDDNPSFIGSYGKDLREEGVGINFDVAATIDEAEDKIENNMSQYAGIVVDCRMSDDDPDEHNGAEFLLQLNREYPFFPTYVYTGYGNDPRYIGRLESSLARAVASKNEPRTSPYLADSFFKTVISKSAEYERVKNKYPERIKFDDYERSPESHAEEIEAHWPKHGPWIAEKMRRGRYAWCVVCGGEIVEHGSGLSSFPGEEDLHALGEQNGLVPFAYGEAFPIESNMTPADQGSEWPATELKNDYYPSIEVRVDNNPLVGDLDTGSVATFVSDELVKQSRYSPMRSATHLNKTFHFSTKRVEVEVAGCPTRAALGVNVVRQWASSPFVDVNGNRRLLVGRSLLSAVPMMITLDTRARRTRASGVHEKP